MIARRPSSQEIDDLAADWAAKVDAGTLTSDEGAKLDAWLDADARHLGAYAKARAVAVHSLRARALGPDFDQAKYGPTSNTEPSRRRLLLMGSALAAGIAIPVLTAGIAWRFLTTPSFATRIGETKVVPLDDGSVVTLNTNSEITVAYTKSIRTIRLLRGEALFDVAKNKARPFIVEANGTQVRAVGTSFTVSILPDQPVKVLVREGIVEIKRPDVPTAPVVRAMADMRAVAPTDSPTVAAKISTAEVTRELAWRVGRLAFEGQTLSEAARMFSRYSEVRIVIDDPSIADETITGLYVSNDPVGFAKAVAVSLNLHVEVNDDEVRLSRGKS